MRNFAFILMIAGIVFLLVSGCTKPAAEPTDPTSMVTLFFLDTPPSTASVFDVIKVRFKVNTLKPVTIMVDWGDMSSKKFVNVQNNEVIEAQHKYAEEGLYPVSVFLEYHEKYYLLSQYVVTIQ